MADRFRYWSYAVDEQTMPVKIEHQKDFAVAAGLTSAIIGETRTIEIFGGAQIFERTAAEIRREDRDALHLAIPSTGSSIVEQDGRQAIIAAGEMVFFDSSRPFRVAMRNQFLWKTLAIPKSSLRLSTGLLQNITAIPLARNSGINRFIQPALQNIVSQSSILEDDLASESIGSHAIDLIAALIRTVSPDVIKENGQPAVLHQQVMAFIRQHHGEPLLSPSLIARVHHISLRTLHMAFAASGCSLMDTVRILRMKLARVDLANPYKGHLSVAQIACTHGFSTPSGFARVFRTTYGQTATEYRRETARTGLLEG